MKQARMAFCMGMIFSSMLQARTITGIVSTVSDVPLDSAIVVIDGKKVRTNKDGRFSYTAATIPNSLTAIKNGHQFKKVDIAQNVDTYSVKLSEAVFSQEFAPPLRVVGGMLYNAKDQPVRLQGLSIHEAPNLREADFVNFSQKWKVNVVRLVMHNHDRKEESWPSFLDKVDTVMKWSKKYKIYVLIDGYHESGSSGSVVSHWDRVQKVWDRLMPRLKNYDHVIWQIYNEPNGEGGNNWAAWAPYAKILVDKIRSYKPVVNAIAVPAAVWATDLDLTKATIDREEIIYSFHPYVGRPSPHKPVMWDARFGYLQKRDIAPVFCSEWAAHDGSGDTANQVNTYFRPIMRYFNDNDVHFSHWGYFPSWGGMANLVTSRIGEPEKRTIWGDLLFKYFNGQPWDSAMALPTIPGKIEAESFDGMSGLRTEGSSDAGGGQSLSYVTNNSWTSYDLNSGSSSNYVFSIRASSGGSGGSVSLLVDGQKKLTLAIPSTGGWGVWKTFSAPEGISIPKGSRTIRLEFTGGSSLFNVNWFSLDASSVSNSLEPSVENAVRIRRSGSRTTISVPLAFNGKSLAIYHLDGVVAKRISLDGGVNDVILDDLQKGGYLVKVESDHDSWQQFVVVP